MNKYNLTLLLSLLSLNAFAGCPDWVRKDLQGEECAKSFKNLEETAYEMKSVYCPSLEFIVDTYKNYEQTMDDMKLCFRNPKMFEANQQAKKKLKENENTEDEDKKNKEIDIKKKCLNDLAWSSGLSGSTNISSLSYGRYLIYANANNIDVVKSFFDRNRKTMNENICSELSQGDSASSSYSEVVNKAKNPKIVSCEHVDTSLCGGYKFAVVIGPFSKSDSTFGATDVTDLDSSSTAAACKNDFSKISDIAYSYSKCRFSNVNVNVNDDGSFECIDLNGTKTKRYKVEDDCSVTKLD